MKPHLTSREGGFALTEALVALAITGIVATGAMLIAQHSKRIMKALEHGQAADALEFGLTPLLARPDVVVYSASRATGSSDLVRCLQGRGGCREGARHNIAMYLPNAPLPFSGPSVGYDGGGAVCPKDQARCARFKLQTSVVTFCGAGTTCVSPAHVAVSWQLMAGGKVIRKGAVERIIPPEQVTKSIVVTCREKELLRGVGLNGEPLCVPLARVQFEDATGLASDGTFKVTPVDCRSFKSGPEDQYYVQAITKEGKVKCAPKTW